jgi:hypothetical protein
MDDLQKKFVDLGNCRDGKQLEWYKSIAERGIDPFDPEHFPEIHAEFGGTIIDDNDSWTLAKNAVQYDGEIEYQFLIVPKFFATSLIEVSPKAMVDLRDIVLTAQTMFQFDGHFFYFRGGDTRQTGASVVRLHANIIVPKCKPDGRTKVYPIVKIE